jgi:hypothetical protein
MSGNNVHKWGGAAFVVGNLLFVVNKLDEMSRLFLGHRIPDVISGQDTALILLGQVALIIGFVAYYRFYAQRVGRFGMYALRLLSGGGIVLAVGHISFMSTAQRLFPFAEALFALVLLGMLLLLIGLFWFGVLTLRQPVLSDWGWLPLFTGLMGTLGFIVFGGEEKTATFLVFRTLFALGLIGLGVILWREKSAISKTIR